MSGVTFHFIKQSSLITRTFLVTLLLNLINFLPDNKTSYMKFVFKKATKKRNVFLT